MSENSLDTTFVSSAEQASAPRSGLLRNYPLIGLLAILALCFFGKALWSTTLFRPYLVAQTDDGGRVTLLHYGLTSRAKCQNQVREMASAMQSTCPWCTVLESTCKTTLDDEQQSWLSDAPLPMPSARSPQGVVLYDAPSIASAQAVCQQSEQQTAAAPPHARIRCFAPLTARPFPSLQQARMDGVGQHLAQLFAGMALVALMLIGILGGARASPALRRRASFRHWGAKLTLCGMDALVMMAAFAVLGFPDFDEPWAMQQFDTKNLFAHAALMAILIGWFWVVLEHYTRRRPFWDELHEIFRKLALQLLLAGAALFYADIEAGREATLLTWASLFLLLPLGRASARTLLDAVGLWRLDALIIGTGHNAREACLAIMSEPAMGYHIRAFVSMPGQDNEHTALEVKGQTLPVIPGSRLDDDLSELDQPQIILALDSNATPEAQRWVQQWLHSCHRLHVIPSLRGLPLYGTQLSYFFSHQVLFLTVRNNLSRRSYRWLKRSFDVVAASLLLVLLAPLMAFVAWRIWREDGGPVIFRQPRVAQGGGQFGFLKFRSMVRDADAILAQWKRGNTPEWQRYYANNFKLDNDPRVLKTGRWIRGTSIDELPQLFNVLRGEMSLVGPRPLLARELDDYGHSIRYYTQARPGITGLWQISGRSSTTFQERAMLDQWYVQNWSLWYDIAILFRTVDVVFNRRGAH